MNQFKKQLIKSGFYDETLSLGENPYDFFGDIKYQVAYPFKEGHIEIKGYNENDSVEITIWNESGAELLFASGTPENYDDKGKNG